MREKKPKQNEKKKPLAKYFCDVRPIVDAVLPTVFTLETIWIYRAIEQHLKPLAENQSISKQCVCCVHVGEFVRMHYASSIGFRATTQ